jgi:uncharacterized protein YukE
MAELGQTQDPTELVPSNPEAIEDNVRVLRARADRAGYASEGLKAIDTGAWTGPAARAFHDKFSYEPAKWYDAADSMLSAADALDHYAGTLRWARAQATAAFDAWNEAQAATGHAQVQHDEAAANGENPLDSPTLARRLARRPRTPSTALVLSSPKSATRSREPSAMPAVEHLRTRAGSTTQGTSSPMPAAISSMDWPPSVTPLSTTPVMR